MKITYHGHACFSVESNNYTIVLDPYCGVKGYKDVELDANEVICSHAHRDHAYINGVRITKKESPFKIEKIASYHDDANGSLRGTNDITVLKAEEKTVVHLGDLGHMLNEDVINQIRYADVLMIPVGGFYTIDASTALKIINEAKPKIIIPMHYQDNDKGLEVIDSIDNFLKIADEYKNNMQLVRGYEKSINI